MSCRPKTEAPAAPPAPPIQSSVPGFVADCRPCRYQMAPGQAPWDFTFVIDSTTEGRAVSAIEARQEPGVRVRLPVHDMVPIPASEPFFFGATDLDGDGNLDLLVATVRGVANTYADYWRAVPDSTRFRYLGRYPLFTRDSVSGRLQSYERGGAGGWVYQAREWAFRGDSLVVMREEVEEPTATTGQYLRITRARVDSLATDLRVIRRERVRDSL